LRSNPRTLLRTSMPWLGSHAHPRIFVATPPGSVGDIFGGVASPPCESCGSSRHTANASVACIDEEVALLSASSPMSHQRREGIEPPACGQSFQELAFVRSASSEQVQGSASRFARATACRRSDFGDLARKRIHTSPRASVLLLAAAGPCSPARVHRGTYPAISA